MFVKRRILLPLTRWLYEYTVDNFQRQERVNRMLVACIEELAIENARLRRDLLRPGERLPDSRHEAGVRRSALRSRSHRRLRASLPGHRRAPRGPSRRHDPDQLRAGLRDVAQRVSRLARLASAADVLRFPVARSASRPARGHQRDRVHDALVARGTGIVVRENGPQVPGSSSTCGSTAANTTASCSGRTATITRSSGCRSSPIARFWCRRPKRIR